MPPNENAPDYTTTTNDNLYAVLIVTQDNVEDTPGSPITNNEDIELYISKYSYPWYFRHNAIIDEDNAGNPNDPLLYFAHPAGSKINQKDIRYNCWGDDFDADEDLYPSAYFYYTPT